MLKRTIVLIAVCSLVFFGTAAAQGAANSKIGIVNLQKVLMESKSGRDAIENYKKEVESKQAMLKSKEDAVKKLDEQFRSSAAKMKPAERKAKEESLASEIKELNRLRQDLGDELKKRDADLTAQIMTDVISIVRRIGQEGRYTVIFQASNNVVYLDNAADITDEVVKIYDGQKK